MSQGTTVALKNAQSWPRNKWRLLFLAIGFPSPRMVTTLSLELQVPIRQRENHITLARERTDRVGSRCGPFPHTLIWKQIPETPCGQKEPAWPTVATSDSEDVSTTPCQ